MKKNVRTGNKSSLTLRREHIRLLTPVDLQSAVGGRRFTTIVSERVAECTNSNNVHDTCG